MPSLRKKVAGFMRHYLAGAVENIGQGEQTLRSPRSMTQDFASGCFITRYLDGLETKQEGPAIVHGRNPEELPIRQLGSFQEDKEVFAAHTGPDNGLIAVNVQQKHLSINDIDIDYIDMLDQGEQYRNTSTTTTPTIAGISDWFIPHETAYGIATTLYEKNPTNDTNNGEPIADCFGIVVRSNSAILALADGVNWGTKASIAARSAVHGSMEYLNNALFCPSVNNEITTTKDVFIALLRSFHAAHSLILQEQGMLTTLTVCAVLPLPNSESNTNQKKYVACTCNVGDSLAYVYSRKTGVREITRGSHDIHCMRDMRDALGALGPVDGCNPELNNLTLAMTEVENGDIVFLTSDGISDNFDPVVGKFAILPCHNSIPDSTVKNHAEGRSKTRRKSVETLRHTESGNSNRNKSNLPVVEAYQRHELTLLRMEDLLRRGVSGEGPPCNSAKHLCKLLLDFAVRITAAKRRILEDTDLYYAQSKDGQLVQLSKQEQRTLRKETLDKVSMIPGKLDHATVVAYVVGSFDSEYGL
ncbi:PP2C-like domain-containing protein CG9801 isoform X1 [Megalopta genalis]|uniref:PP2C-like domain-containing protein CG9801 isoform X1 n=1 Tax=Megalopta genalis TaxID=115081 RepID=UPI001443753A|nr:PP2C-like domain-containing protein CG9801 isoform X1 [Megalopta genalis]XP_033341027.1 PP2C-like domain-containing protein CG9801 isoform X1 [Megalopta genalis]XP_033341028.1 PP2C-like domain-containing protein CG9801 isoform X1 [Megalopta genalis]XP_033341029.1 PP2C-like domain-containing protein CG9801 isoform X1 [Megalopta genalis]XP_033341030.1 PP2C-like domain-containing protein CG9801 isoform X1 [Megalopta genalis]